MNLDKQKKQKNPLHKDIELILGLINSNKFLDAKKEIDKQFKNFPNSPILFNILGAFFYSKNEIIKAVENYKRSIKIDPNYAQAYNNLGTALHRLDKISEAIESYRKAIDIKKDFAESYNNLGNALRDLKKPKEALDYLQKAIQLKLDYAEAYNNLGSIYIDLGHKQDAIDSFKKAIKIKPNFADAYNNLGLLLSDLAEFDQALTNYNKAISLQPNNEKFFNNLGNLLNDLKRFNEAADAFDKAIKIKPDYVKAYSNLLFGLNYKIDFDPQLYLSIAKKFRKNCKLLKREIPKKYNYEKATKKIKLGFVSADFGNHPGGFFTLSTLRELRKKNFELIAYATTTRKDEISHYFRSLFTKWHSVEKRSDEDVIKQILDDGVNILIDSQGHSDKNRLPIFMYKPAPVQITWLGQGSTGIHEIDYFIGSPHITPSEEDKNYVEKVLRLPEISQCFTTPDFDLEINELPAKKNNFITFGCFNKLTKINDQVISLWSKILLSVPNSKLLLKNKFLDNNKVAKDISEKFEKLNINKERLLLRGESNSRKKALEVFHEIDIALDPFPFQGNTSTCESVWMGVPVLTLKGDRYLFHFGESINSNLNMSDWIANSQEEYVVKAKKFSSDYNYLAKMRTHLREKALKSPVFDAKRFSDHFSELLWKIWKDYDGKN